jgi:hypothetical protein
VQTSRGPALAKQRAAAYRYRKQSEPFRTEQSPGTGGFGSGLETQIQRNYIRQFDRERAESLRPENEIQQSILNKIKTA